MTTRRAEPVWLSDPPPRRSRYPRHRGHLDVEVVVVGGGLTGCATAYAFAAAGIGVILLEANGVGQGSTAASAGLLLQEQDTDYRTHVASLGRPAARLVWQMHRRAMLDGAATLRRLRICCALENPKLVTFTNDPDGVPDLGREFEMRKANGFGAVWLTADRLHRATGLRAQGGILTRGHAQLDPFRACLGLAAAAAGRNAIICERSPVTRVRADRHGVDLKTDRGTVRARQVVVATGSAAPLFPSLVRHVRQMEGYAVLTPPLGAALRREFGARDAVLRDTCDPRHVLRWTRDRRVLFGGADQPETSARRRGKVLVQRTGQLMYELSLLYPGISGVQPERSWVVPIPTTADGLPYVGPHSHYPHHLFALGHGRSGLASAFLASRILLRRHRERPDPEDELFGFGR
jgi:glycine/D-amino acid oxidase-like deaminating enzyme